MLNSSFKVLDLSIKLGEFFLFYPVLECEDVTDWIMGEAASVITFVSKLMMICEEEVVVIFA